MSRIDGTTSLSETCKAMKCLRVHKSRVAPPIGPGKTNEQENTYQRIAKGAGKKGEIVEKCRKVSKMFLTLFDDF